MFRLGTGPNDSVFNYLNQSPPGSQLLGSHSLIIQISPVLTLYPLKLPSATRGSFSIFPAIADYLMFQHWPLGYRWPHCPNEWLKRHDVQWDIRRLRSSHEFQPRQFTVGFSSGAQRHLPENHRDHWWICWWGSAPSGISCHLPMCPPQARSRVGVVGVRGGARAASIALHPRRADTSPQFVIFRDDAKWLDIGTRARDAQG
jgi:hypothetical protein